MVRKRVVLAFCFKCVGFTEASRKDLGRSFAGITATRRLVQVDYQLADTQVGCVSPNQAGWAASGVKAVYNAVQFQGIN